MKEKVKEIGFFGSFARNEMTPESDIDILVEYSRGTTLLDIVRMKYSLEKITGRKVDLSSRNAMDNLLFQEIQKDLKIVYHA